jgi:hypothetical protein
VHGMGNSQWTHKQQTSAKKMATHCNMTIVNMGAFAADNAAVLRAALQSPHRFRDATKKSSTYQVIWDSGASISISSPVHECYNDTSYSRLAKCIVHTYSA